MYSYEQIGTGLEQNGYQALQATMHGVSTNSLQQHLAAQLKNSILARNDVDRIVTDNSVQVGSGTLADGTSISFNSSSLE